MTRQQKIARKRAMLYARPGYAFSEEYLSARQRSYEPVLVLVQTPTQTKQAA